MEHPNQQHANLQQQANLQQAFISSAIRVVARDGLSKATTKAIAAEAGLNEAYIYKCFRGKNEMLSMAFHQEDVRFAKFLRQLMMDSRHLGLSWRNYAFTLWKRTWQYILTNKDNCKFYCRYYYSAECQEFAYEKHMRYYRGLIRRVSGAFKPDTNVDMVVHQIFDTMLVFALRVLNGEIEDNDDTTYWTFWQIYYFVEPHIRDEYLKREGPST